MIVIYAEKASLAKEIANALGASKRKSNPADPRMGHWEFTFKGEKAVLVHGQGHLLQLEDAAAYGAQFKNWNLSVYPCIPNNFRLKVKANTAAVFNYIKPFFEIADSFINATDADREGELIFDYIYKTIGGNKPWKRVWIEDLTSEKICYAFNNLKAGYEMRNLQLAGEARAIADWLLGINMTIALTSKFSNHNGVLACGRVQTPTLALIVNREHEIENFIKKAYYKILGNFSTLTDKYEGEYIGGNFNEREEAEAVLQQCNDKGKIKSKEVKSKTVNAPLLYNSTQLQVVCGKKLGWDLKKAESVMQKLYESKYMSYPRTSSEHLTEAMKPEITAIVEKILNIPEYSNFKIDKSHWNNFTKHHFDDSKVGSHPAITPTLHVPPALSDLDDDERVLYDLLAKSLIRLIYPPVVLEKTTIITTVNNYDFKSTGSVIKNTGWYIVDSMPEKDNVLPDVAETDMVSANIKIITGETKPPKRYTEPDLISAMELAGQKIEDEEVKTLMKLQKKGLGTDATRVPTVKALFAREYISKKGKTIYPTDKGKYIIDTLPVSDMKSAIMTGELEKYLNDIELGKATYDSFVNHIKEITDKWYKIINNTHTDVFIDKSMICPACGQKLIKGKNNVFCSAYTTGCKFSIPYSLCGKKLTKSQIDMLIASKRTNVIKGFTSKSGKSFDASLKIDNTGKIEFIFPNQKRKSK